MANGDINLYYYPVRAGKSYSIKIILWMVVVINHYKGFAV